mgnify:CR=1 FL=1
MPEVIKDASPAPSPGKPVDTTVVEGTETDLEESDTDETGDEAPKGPLHKSDRWKKVHGEWKQFSAFQMSPLELQAALVRLAKHEKAIAKAEEAEGSTAEEKELAVRRKAARKELSAISPEIDKVNEAVEKTNVLYDAINRRAVRQTKVEMTVAGMKIGDKNVEAMTDVLAGIIQEDEELYDDYFSDPKGTVKEAFKRFTADLTAGVARAAKAGVQRDKTKLLALPKTHKAAGTAEVAPNRTAGPKNLNEARKSAQARLATLEE